jgi:hypothetical protein
MLYLDRLTAEEVQGYDVGMVLTAAFCRRPAAQGALVPGKDARLWWGAVDALNEALRQQPEQVSARAALGLAHLFHPDRKDAGRAAELLAEAVKAAHDQKLDRAAQAALLLNLGVARLANGQAGDGLKCLEQAEALGGTDAPFLTAALLYNRARHLAAAEGRASRAKAVELLETYLKTTSPLTTWWPLAHERYTRLCEALGRKARARGELIRPLAASLDPPAGVRLEAGQQVVVGAALEEVLKQFGPAHPQVIARRTNLACLRLDRQPLEILATDRVLGIRLATAKAPPLRLSWPGAALRVGMTVKELEDTLGREYHACEFPETGLHYRFYPECGIAARLQGSRVLELIVVQVARR